MQHHQPVFARPDTLLGVCEALGQDFGFNANILRVAFAVSLFWQPLLSFAVYGVLGVAVLLSRMTFPARRVAEEVAAKPVPASDNDEAAPPTAIAA